MKEKTCLISGANRGLGLSLVERALSKSWSVYAISHREDCPELRALSVKGPLKIFVASQDKDKSVARLGEELLKLDKPIDLIINNAAVLGDIEKKLGDGLDFEDALWVYNVNVLGPLRLTEAVWPLLLKSSSPTVVNISSEAGSIANCGRDDWYAYNSSKAALNMAGRVMHNHLKRLGGRVLQIHPGWVKTWIRGYFDNSATLTAEESAQGIWERIDAYRSEKNIPDAPPFLDWEGKSWPW